ncbi:dihydropyrimidinase [Limobrevibacterium gyesilva]|uniref:D-hydantoinase n=1 Tax=Limobrevibacterium gyesilva TaxID=2991712 RepID=A0AA42CGQ7_9PROT|nr:dihydropyrimidinase [Limobrevibacterium gyesilva]MCW3474227.1 dihydropyrimidinase [Limobrevibacterium gyesilva]
MADYDLVVRGGTVVTAADTMRADIGIRDGRIVALAGRLEGAETIDAGGLLVLPGGVDTHCHIEQLQEGGGADEESWTTGSTACFAGGTTSVITFSTQFKGHGILEPLAEYRRRAQQAMVDYSFHQIITDASDEVVWRQIPDVVASGVRSLKVFLTYDPLHLDDRGFLRVLAAARRSGAFVTVHCENYEAINWRTEALLKDGRTAPKYHAWARPRMIEREATHRAIALAELVDQPIQIFHVSCSEVADEIARARARGLKVWGETCPQYFVLSASDMDRPGFEGAKFMCSPAPRTAADSEALWNDIRAGTLDIVSSDHSGWSYDGARGKKVNGADANFRDIPNGVPGLAARLPILFSEGVAKGRIDVNQFVRITATNPARLFGLYPRKGSIAPGFDADLVLWDPARKTTLTNALMQHVIDYTPYEGIEVTGWPVATIRRGAVVMRDGHVQAEPGSGTFLARGGYDMIKPRGVLPDGFDASRFA